MSKNAWKEALKRANKILKLEEERRAKFARERQRLIPESSHLNDRAAAVKMAVIRCRHIQAAEEASKGKAPKKRTGIACIKNSSKDALRTSSGSSDNPTPSTSATARQEMAREAEEAEQLAGGAEQTEARAIGRRPRRGGQENLENEHYFPIYHTKRTKRPGETLMGYGLPDKIRKIVGGMETRNNIPDKGETAPNIYADSTLILDLPSCKIYIKRANFIRQKKFDSTNRLYRINIVRKPKTEAPLMLDFLKVLETALEKVITEIQGSYDDNKYRQIYLTISDKRNITQSGINTANFSLQTDKMDIIHQCTERFFIFLDSHQEMTLNNAFHIDVKILGIQHVSERLQKNKIDLHLPKAIPTGCLSNIPNSLARRKWLFSPPVGFPGEPMIFTNKCLMVAAIFGVWHICSAIAEEIYGQNSAHCKMWHVIRGLDSFDSSEKEKTRKAGEAVFTEICEVAKTQEINLTKEHFFDRYSPEIC